jgi:hypothetical protein
MAFGAMFVDSSHPTFSNADIRKAALRTISDKMDGTPTGKCFLYFPLAVGYRPSSGSKMRGGSDYGTQKNKEKGHAVIAIQSYSSCTHIVDCTPRRVG